MTVGSLEHRKGPDIFCNAIRLLPSAVREKAVFLFVGKAADKGMYSAVDSLVRDYPRPFSTASGWSARRSNP